MAQMEFCFCSELHCPGFCTFSNQVPSTLCVCVDPSVNVSVLGGLYHFVECYFVVTRTSCFCNTSSTGHCLSDQRQDLPQLLPIFLPTVDSSTLLPQLLSMTHIQYIFEGLEQDDASMTCLWRSQDNYTFTFTFTFTQTAWISSNDRDFHARSNPHHSSRVKPTQEAEHCF